MNCRSDGASIWQNTLPGHNGEAVVVEQCRLVKAKGTGTRCMVYRNTELALQVRCLDSDSGHHLPKNSYCLPPADYKCPIVLRPPGSGRRPAARP